MCGAGRAARARFLKMQGVPLLHLLRLLQLEKL